MHRTIDNIFLLHPYLALHSSGKDSRTSIPPTANCESRFSIMKCTRRTRTLFQQLEGTSKRRGVSSSSFRSSRPRCQAEVSSAATKCHTTYQPQRAYASISASELQFGQPVHETHPHLLDAGEGTKMNSTA